MSSSPAFFFAFAELPSSSPASSAAFFFAFAELHATVLVVGSLSTDEIDSSGLTNGLEVGTSASAGSPDGSIDEDLADFVKRPKSAGSLLGGGKGRSLPIELGIASGTSRGSAGLGAGGSAGSDGTGICITLDSMAASQTRVLEGV